MGLDDFGLSNNESAPTLITSLTHTLVTEKSDIISSQPFRWECACVAHTFFIPPTIPWTAEFQPPGASLNTESNSVPICAYSTK
jgi:hypothetical protein